MKNGNKFIHLDLFSGLGLFSYAADYVWNLEHIFCEIEDWPYRFLKQEHPNARIERDIKNFNGTEYTGRTFLLTAGVPCQPASVAGKRKGTEDDRWLWPEALRVLFESQAECAIFENPLGILTLEKGLVFENLLLEMESQGYEVQPYIIPACAIGSVHRRDRVWIVAHSTRNNDRGNPGEFQETNEQQKSERQEERIAESCGTDQDAQNSKQPGTGNQKPEIADEGRRTRESRREGLRQGNGKVGSSGITPTDPDASNPEKAECEQSRGTRSRRKGFADNGCNTTNAQKPGLERSDSEGGACSRGRIAELSGISGWQKEWPEVATELCRVDVSSTDRVHRLKALGNTIQWEVAYELMQAIKEIE